MTFGEESGNQVPAKIQSDRLKAFSQHRCPQPEVQQTVDADKMFTETTWRDRISAVVAPTKCKLSVSGTAVPLVFKVLSQLKHFTTTKIQVRCQIEQLKGFPKHP